MIEIAKTNHHKLIVELLACKSWRKFYPNVITRKAMHIPSLRRLLKQHFCLCSDISFIERMGLPVRHFKQRMRPSFLLGIIDNVRNLECRGARTL